MYQSVKLWEGHNLISNIIIIGWGIGRRNAPAASCGRVQITPWNFLANGNIFQVKGFVKYFSREAKAWSVRGSRGGKTGKLQLFKLFRDQSRKWRILKRNWSRKPHFTLIKAYLVNDEKLNLNIGIFGLLGRWSLEWSSHPITSRVMKIKSAFWEN